MAFTTKRKLSDLTLRRLRKYKQDTDVTEQEIIKHVHQAIGQSILNRYYQTKSDEYAMVDDAFVYTFRNISVSEENGEYFIPLPSSTLALPFGMGIKMVAPNNDQTNAYRPVPNGYLNLYNGLAAESLSSRIGYYQENTRVIFVNVNDANSPTKVLIKIHAPIDGIGLDEPLNIPPDQEAEIIDIVVQRYLPTIQLPADEVNDGVDQA